MKKIYIIVGIVVLVGVAYWMWPRAPKPTVDDASDAAAAQQEADNVSIQDLDQQIQDLDAQINKL